VICTKAGSSTQTAHPDSAVAVDLVHNEPFVVEKEYILVYPRTANGDTAPIRVIRDKRSGIIRGG
jgi:hypothetical protein